MQAVASSGVRLVPPQLAMCLQVMTYKHLLELLPTTCSLAHLTKFFHLLHLDIMQPLSDTVQHHARSLGLVSNVKRDGQLASLTLIAEELQHQISSMPTCSQQMIVRYIWQSDCEVLGETAYDYDHAWLVFRLQQHMGFWEGTWTPAVVSDQEKWKCSHCLFCQTCPAGRKHLQV